jgi:predicted NACHT family NTPase
MLLKIYNWRRFWCPRTGKINLSDGGYLYNPDSKFGKIYNPDIVPFESIGEFPCLALLGEPGIGKSLAMRAQREAIKKKTEIEGGQFVWMDLRSYGSEDRLIRNLFESSTFTSWVKGDHLLHVFLDSLDECLLRIDTLSTLLIDELEKVPVERLYLRIACRTADWPMTIEDGLIQLWGKDVVGVYELTPLRRGDVAEAAKANGLDPEAFLREIDRMEAVTLAIVPVTLNFLLDTYKRTGKFPQTKSELYLKGCRLLCEEPSESRREAGLIGRLNADQRLAVAARIAAVNIVANRYAIWTSIDRGDVPDEDITIQELSGGTEYANGEEFRVTNNAIKETLATGLFSSRGPNRMGWSHQTYAEFLAAWYLVRHRMTLAQMMSLVVHPGDPGKKLVPQLHETVAWLAGMVPDIFTTIIVAEPEVLLRSDVATADEKDRAKLVENLLRLYEKEKLLDRDALARTRYRKLSHKGLADQLRPYIRDNRKAIIVRGVAIDIAEECELKALQADLAPVVLDSSQPIPVRVHAAYAIARMGDADTKNKLKPLATDFNAEDVDDQLKGCALRALWPDQITAEELFQVITPPKSQNFIGAYHAFLAHELVERLPSAGLLVALKWAPEQERRHSVTYSFGKLMDNIMLKAWENLDSSGVPDAFAKAALSRVKLHDEIVRESSEQDFRTQLIEEDEKRRKVLKAMIPIINDPDQDVFLLANPMTPIVLSKDVEWMLDQLKAAETEREQYVWACLIENVFEIGNISQIGSVLLACQSIPILEKRLKWLVRPVELDSAEAKSMKAAFLKRKKLMERDQEPLLTPPPADRIAQLLDEFESGNRAAWWRLNMEMTLESYSRFYGDELDADLTLLPGWGDSNEETRARILKAAKEYVLKEDCKKLEWLAKDVLYRPAYAGYRALRLLLKEDPDFISSLPADIWKKWAAIILAFPDSSREEDNDAQDKLVESTYQHAPDEIIEVLMTIIDKENEKHEHVFITRKVERCWDQRLADAMLKKAQDPKLKPDCLATLLSDLLDHEIPEARTFAESFLRVSPPSSGNRRARALVATRVLISHTKDSGWNVVWAAIQQDPVFGREVIESVAYHSRDDMIQGQALSEDELADFFIWLARQYPYSQDPKHEGAHSVSPRDSAVDLKDAVLRQLKNRGTFKACDALRRIAQELPELDWLKWTIQEGEENARRKTWIPPEPRHILSLVTDKQLHLVQSGDELLEVLIESLHRLEAKLQGETPSSRDIWDRAGKKYRPVEENDFSDHIKIFLDGDLKVKGVIVNREVRIHRGERTDIHVDAILQAPDGKSHGTITAIVEVKGCWHSELSQAMETQLVGKYLKDSHCQHGLYLVGWFNCENWDDNDYRKGRPPKMTMGEAQELLDSQAASLSEGGLEIKALVINAALH